MSKKFQWLWESVLYNMSSTFSFPLEILVSFLCDSWNIYRDSERWFGIALVPLQLITWTTGSAQASWREMAAHSLAHPVSPQPWALLWALLFTPPKMLWTGCLQEGRWCGASELHSPTPPNLSRSELNNASLWLRLQLLTDKLPGPHTDQMLHSCKELGSQCPCYQHQASGAGCVVLCVVLFLLWVSTSWFVPMHAKRVVSSLHCRY